MAKILVSSGALIGRPNNRNYKLLKDFVPKLHFDGLEFMLYSDWYPVLDEVMAFLNELPIEIPVIHCQKTVGELITLNDDETALHNFKENCRLASSVGASKMVLHLWNGVPSDSNFEHNLSLYPVLLGMANDVGVDLLVENVLCNVKDPKSRWEELLAHYPDAHLIFDTKMADFHGQINMLYDPENAYLYKDKHIRHYHVNDYGGGYMTWEDLRVLPPGKGHIDFKRFFRYIKEIGYDDTFTVEATAFRKDGTVDIDMLNKAYEDVRRFLSEQS